jgi:hypothetical protein
VADTGSIDLAPLDQPEALRTLTVTLVDGFSLTADDFR